jgi:FkbM family methyltransferase
MLIKEYGKAKARVLRRFGLEPVYNIDPDKNGEYEFLRLISRLPEVARYTSIVDVGANVGDWTFRAAECFQGMNIHDFLCVEPIPKFAQQLRERFASNPGVKIFETALSSESGGNADIFNIGGGGRMYRSYRRNPGRKQDEVSGTKAIIHHVVGKTTGDDLLKSSPHRPYLVKIDCDGHDLHVLHGFAATLQKMRPLVQFEYCDFWIGAGSRLRDACLMLYGAGYNTYKLFPDRLARFDYNGLFETFGYQNIVAAPKEFPSFSDRTIAFHISE